MTLIDQISAIFRRQQPPAQTSAAPLPPAVEAEERLRRRFRAESERKAIVLACRKMYYEDARARKMHKVLARDMVKGGYTLRVKNNDAAQKIADDLYRRLRLDQTLDDWVRLTARDGDSFLELVIDDQLQIVAVSRKPTLLMRRNSDLSDRFSDPQRAYWMTPGSMWAGDEERIPPEATIFADWRMIHARWEHDEGQRYGWPMLASGIAAHRRVDEGELDMAVRRKTRASLRYLHVMEGATADEIEAYKRANKAALSSDSAVADFFSNRAGSLTAIQGDATLGEINDVMHQVKTWMASGDVPSELVAYGEELNRDVLGEKQAAYRENLEQLREWVTAELVLPLLERQWLLAGIYPPGLEYDLVWKAQSAVSAREILDVIDAAMRMRLMGLPDALIWQVLARFLPGVNADLLNQTVASTGDDPARYASILAGFSGFAPGNGGE